MDSDKERRLSQKLHDLRTPLNQIIGFSEMLIEIAEEEGHRDFVEGLGTIREAGIELNDLLRDRHLVTFEAQAGKDYWPLSEAVRDAIGRVNNFNERALANETEPRLGIYRDDLVKIRSATRHFLDMANSSGLLIHLETARHWENHAPIAPYSASAATGGAKGRILVVDDESLNCEVLSRRLRREGYFAVTAGSGLEALKMLHRDSYDAVLLDFLMPEMNGMEVLQTLKSDPCLRHLPVIMLSALTEIERVVRCIELGAEDFLSKPINSVLLRARLGACLEKKRLRDLEQAHFEALHAEKERLSVTLRSLADAVVTTDAEGRIVLLNDVVTSFTGFTREEATGMAFGEVFRIFNRSNNEPAADVVIEALKRNTVVELATGIAIMPPEGIEKLLSARAAPILDHEGKINGTVVVLRDITEKEKMAEELLRSSKLQSIGVLAGGLAHDFNNMLTAVMGNLSLVRQLDDLPPEVYCSLNEAEQGAKRAQELTQYLLTFAEGGAPIKQLIQVRALIQQTSAFVVRGSNVHCDFDLLSNLWKTEADPNQIAQVISNIVLNAVEATPNGGKIQVKAENIAAPIATAPHLPAGDYLCISVRDRGIGIAPEYLSRIYDPFFTTKKQARGLGLAAAYSIVQRHGGHIAVESAPGEGTVVTIHLKALRPATMAIPVDKPLPARAPVADAPAETRANGRKPLVLIMDDDDSIRMLAKLMFKRLDYEVVTTADGDAALKAHASAAAEGHPFDLVVMDLTIPGGMGGKETIKKLREKDTGVAAIVSSGYSNDPVMANYEEHGFNGVLPKPYTMENMVRVLKQLNAPAKV
ncbi:MAG TPA: response regulator [Chthoniobacteraceae bacterium]|nr:response regulator [Chthoniobacteraceae bacterium]